MLHALSTHYFVNHRLTTVWLDKIWKAGIPAVEIFCARQHLDYQNKAQVDELAHWFHDSPMMLHSLHAPMYNDDCWGRTGPNAVITITEPVKSKRIVMVDEIKRALEVAETIPCKYLIQHIGVGGEEYDEYRVDAAFTALEELSVFAKQRGVQILLENIPNKLCSAERLVQFLEMTHLDLHFCFDTGHANMMEGVEQAYQIMSNRIRSTHVHDNDSVNDTHYFPYLKEGGTINWRKTMQLLRSRAEHYPLLLELKEDPSMGSPLDAISEVFRRLEDEPPAEEA
ncbi:MAG TPA: sugar phosphate isomerase/epimerase family protein [Bryobacteraceae bacterium]|nr:sugar phosphate isomerase/epimerase family protein [Bryobacteraceae bacterium]